MSEKKGAKNEVIRGVIDAEIQLLGVRLVNLQEMGWMDDHDRELLVAVGKHPSFQRMAREAIVGWGKERGCVV